MKKKKKHVDRSPWDVAPVSLRVILSHFSCVWDGVELITKHEAAGKACQCCKVTRKDSECDGYGAGLRYRVTPHYKPQGSRKTFAAPAVWACRVCFVMWDDGCNASGQYDV
jgi:hypothetical protein